MTEWFIKSPGENLSPSRDEEGMFLCAPTDDVPDWVNVPDHPGLPGGQRRVLRGEIKQCKRPGHAHRAKHYILEGPVSCCECEVDKLFQWYKNQEGLQ